MNNFSVIGVDSYNLTLTGDIGRTVTTAGGGLNEHIPLVIQYISGQVPQKNKNKEVGHIGKENPTRT